MCTGTATGRKARTWLLGLAGTALLGVSLAAEVAAEPSRGLNSYVLLAITDLKAQNFTFLPGVASSGIGVNNAGGWVKWGRRTYFPDGSQIVGDVLLAAGFRCR